MTGVFFVLAPKYRVANCVPLAKSGPTSCFCLKKKAAGIQPRMFIYQIPVVIKTVWLTQPKIFIIWTSTKIVG